MTGAPIAPLSWTGKTRSRVRAALLEHYDRHARDLPWREEGDPYRVWVSEIMLQQTRVDTVLDYYERFLERFPDVETLAEASLDDVLLAWEGLGYYRRARALHGAARVVRERWGGEVPAEPADLRALPGVGAYTAGAIASIAFGEPVAAVDGNVRRVLARWFDRPAPTAAWLRDAAAALVERERPGDWNQALMELGATVCSPRSPACDRCPVAFVCAARAAGTQEERPSKSAPRALPSRSFAVAVVVGRDGRALVRRRPPEGLLGGLWTFPEAPLDGGDVVARARAAAREVGARAEPHAPRILGVVRQRFSHFEGTYHAVVLRGTAGEREDVRWTPLAGRRSVALPKAHAAIARRAAEKEGGTGE